MPRPFLFAAFASLALSAHAEIPLTPQGSAVVVEPGSVEIGGKEAAVKQRVVLPVAPSPFVTIKDEALRLSTDKPAGYAKGTRLKGCDAKDVNAFHAFVPGSLEIRRTQGGELLKEGEDYLVDPEWGLVGLGPKSTVTAQTTVFASYQCSLLRMDTVQVSAGGTATLKAGQPHISAPVPPEADAGCVAIAHVWANYRSTEVTPESIYPISETATQALTATAPGRIPKTLAKLQAGQPVTIVCLGDSVTQGGNASKPELRYVDVFAAGLKAKFPQSQIEVVNLSAGGSNSRQWLHPEKFPYKNLHGPQNPARFERVLEAKPDLVTIEFVNDSSLNPTMTAEAYSEILKRLEPLGSEVILITPHFTMWRMMGFKDMQGQEKRPYVQALRDFATQHHLGLADASARWQHLTKEGLPYLTLLHNTINHPDDRGHRMFAEELWKCFEVGK